MGETVSGSPATLITLESEETMPAIVEATMPRKKSGSGPKLAATKVDRDLIHKAKLIAADRGEPMAGYLSAILRPVVEKDWAKMIRKAGSEGTPES
jgi:hypothetical protein